MARNRKYFPHNSVIYITARTEVGLPLVATHIMNFFIWGILAKARSMHEVKVCHFLFMYNHLHMVLVVDNPEHVSEFMGYVKGEIAHAVNRLLGRRQRTIWCNGYDSPLLLTPADVMKYIRYTYLNPVKASLVDRVKEYPGVSSWEMFVSRNHKVQYKKTSRSDLRPLALPALSVNEQLRLLNYYKQQEGTEHEFILEPYAWMKCFPELSAVSEEQMREELLTEIQQWEEKYREERKSEKRAVVGATALRRQSMLKEYEPKKFGRRMICISSDKKLRRAVIKHFRGICELATEIYRRWKCGELSWKLPPGLLAPRVPTLASAIFII